MKIIWLILALIFGVIALLTLLNVVFGAVFLLFMFEDTSSNDIAKLIFSLGISIAFGGLFRVTQKKFYKPKSK